MSNEVGRKKKVQQTRSRRENRERAEPMIVRRKNSKKTANRSKPKSHVRKKKLALASANLQVRDLDLLLARNDFENMFGNIDVAMVILDKKLRVRRATPLAHEILNLDSADLGRRISAVTSAIDFAGFERTISDCIAGGFPAELYVSDAHGVWYSLRVRPYRTSANSVDGAVLTVLNIDHLKRHATSSRAYAEMMAASIRESLVVLDEHLRVLRVNGAFLQKFKVAQEEVENRPLRELGNGQWNIPVLLESLSEILPKKTELINFEVALDFPGLGHRVMVLNARQAEDETGSRRSIFLAIDDVTEQKKAIDDLRKHSELLQLAHDAIMVRDVTSVILFWNRGAEETYGWSPAEACGNLSHQFLKTEFSEPLDQLNQTLFNTGSWEGELVHWTRAGKRIVVASRQVLQRDPQGRIIGILEINRDITLRKEAEEALRNLSARLLQLQDEERRRIARELHDSTGQSLAALVIHLSAVNAKIADVDPAAADLLREAIQLSQKASDETRTLSYLLYPPTLDYAGLHSALEWYIEGFTQRSKVKVDLKVSLGPNRPAEIVERTLFRIVQESLTNIFRHSGSETATVRIEARSESVWLEVADKGKGIPADVLTTLNSSGGQLGVGIRGMRERVRQLGGWLQIRSLHDGTAIVVTLPSREGVSEEIARPAL
jgi:PAS domain S-box-containing protein